jgi:hypothetical protein
MKSFVAALAALAVLALAFAYVLDLNWQHQADQHFASATSVRLPAHGNTHNLVGKDWSSSKEQ